MFDSGFGIRTGEISGGVLAIDVDGEQADALLRAISGGDIPPTWKWSSGKPGRYQIAFQIPDDLRPLLPNFQRHVFREWNGVNSTQDLDFRYNGHQSCLPPSRHPDTGAYFWIQSPSQTPLAIAPEWLINLLLSFVNSSNSTSGTTNQNINQRTPDSARTPCGCGNHNQGITSGNDLSKLVDEVLGRLTVEQVYNWQGHDWSQGNGKLLGFCPQHGGKSGTAFQVDLTTGEWYCHGCNTGGHAIQYRWFVQGYTGTPTGRDFIDILKQLAWEAGVNLPEWRPQGEPDPEAYAEYVRWEKEQEAIAQAQAEADYLKWIQDRYQKLAKKTAKRNRRLKRSDYSAEQIAEIPPVTLNQELVYTPGCPLPTPEQYRELGTPKIIFQEGDRQSLIRDLMALCWQKASDSSPTGSGKTEDISRWSHTDFEAYRLWLFTENSRRPQTASQEEKFTPLPVRHNGMVSDPSQLTPMGNPTVRWPKDGETPNVTPNCYRAELFHLVAEKGYSIDGDKEDEKNPICKTCRFAAVCPQQPGVGFSFRMQRKEVLLEVETEEGKYAVEPHISLNPMSSLTNYFYGNDVGIWDEWTRILKVTRSLTATLEDFERVWGDMESAAPHIHQQLTPFRLALRAILTAEKSPHYGFHFADIKDKLVLPSDINNIVVELEGLTPNWQEIFSEDSVSTDGVDKSGMSVNEIKGLKRQLASVRRLMRRSPVDNIRQLPVNWLIPTLKILAKAAAGSLGVQWGKLTITLKDERIPAVVQGMNFNLFLDATGSRADLALALGVEEHTIAHIEQAPPTYSNLSLVQVNGFDTAGKERAAIFRSSDCCG